MRNIFVFSILLVSLFLVACGGQNEAAPVPVDENSETLDEGMETSFEEVPRIESTPTPPLPPTFTPDAMAHQGHLYLLPVSGADGSIQYAYKVRGGDTLTAICDMYDVSLKEVMIINDIADANHIEVGNLIIIPVDQY